MMSSFDTDTDDEVTDDDLDDRAEEVLDGEFVTFEEHADRRE